MTNSSVSERITDVVAVSGATSWWWTVYLPWLNDTVLVPIATFLGIVWLAVQIFYKIRKD